MAVGGLLGHLPGLFGSLFGGLLGGLGGGFFFRSIGLGSGLLGGVGGLVELLGGFLKGVGHLCHALIGLLGLLGLGRLLALLGSLLEGLLGGFERLLGIGFAGFRLGLHLRHLLFGHGLGHLGELLSFGLFGGLLCGLGIFGSLGHGLGLLRDGFGLDGGFTGLIGIGSSGCLLGGLRCFGKLFSGSV